jgi:hypothetical protein
MSSRSGSGIRVREIGVRPRFSAIASNGIYPAAGRDLLKI